MLLTLLLAAVSQSVRQPDTEFLLTTCGGVPKGQRSIGRGEYGLQFRIPKHQVQVNSVKPDEEHIRYLVKMKNRPGLWLLWFGVYSLSRNPDPQRVSESVSVSRSEVSNRKGQNVGLDTVGHLPDGTRWRHFVVASESAAYSDFDGEGATYSNVSADVAALFNRIIDSACVAPVPKSDTGTAN